MKPFRKRESATAPDGSVLELFEHDGAFLLRVNGAELMSTRRHQSEDALATLTCAPIADRPGACVLIGGLGLGFTLKSALNTLGADAHVVVSELVPAVTAWNRNPAYGLAHDALDDPRVELVHGDVSTLLADSPARFDAIMLDVDNGERALFANQNARLYQAKGIRLAMHALKPDGWLGYWAAEDEPGFEGQLQEAGLVPAVTKVRAHATAGPWHPVYVATRRPPKPSPERDAWPAR
jgi:spermidine synthase